MAARGHRCPPTRPPALLPYALPCGGVRYLALPMRLSRVDAEAFCRFYGGRLAAPDTAEQFHALHAYLAPLVYRTDVYFTSYHLDVAFAGATRQGVRRSGTPYQWRQWGFMEEGCPPLTTETPYFLMQLTVEQSVWRWDSRVLAPNISSCSNGTSPKSFPCRENPMTTHPPPMIPKSEEIK